MEIQVKRIAKDLPLPEYAYSGDAGFDLYANENVSLNSLERTTVASGLAIEVPEGYVGLIWDRSGLSTKHGIKTLGGVIDAGYRGEIRIGLVNAGTESYEIKRGDKIAQMIIQERQHAKFVEVDDLSETERGANKFGSSGF